MKGSLFIFIQNGGEVSRYKQGAGICHFLVGRKCGMLTYVLSKDGHNVFGAMNARSINNHDALGEAEAAHLIGLSHEERIQRRNRIWFPNVKLQYINAQQVRHAGTENSAAFCECLRHFCGETRSMFDAAEIGVRLENGS